MMMVHALTLVVLLAEPGWEVARDDEDLKVFAREKKGGVQEMKAVGVINAPPERVWQAIRDYDSYVKTMPYMEVSKVLAREDGDKVTWLYSVINAPFVDRRDYVIRILDESKWQDGEGYFKVSWRAANERAPKKPDNVVRVQINDGHWLLEPIEGGKKTRATYYLFTDPGGSVPRWLVNKGNGSAVPDVFEAVRKVSQSQK